jgi:RNA polymerase sigma factor (TIGR02999 family)
MTHKDEASQVTQLLGQLTADNQSVVNAIMPLVYSELRQLASLKLKSDQLNDSICPTILVHEAYLRIAGQQDVNWRSRAHFMAIAAITMRRILVEYARMRKAQKRGGGDFDITFNEDQHSRRVNSERLLDLDIALRDLRKTNPRQASIIEYWFFGGLTHKEIAEVLKVSIPTVRHDWRLSRAWLAARLNT